MSSTIAPPVSPQTDVLPPAKRGAAHAAFVYGGRERASSSGIWVGVFAITMSFAAFTSALFVREGTADWSHLTLPSVLYWNTAVLLISSITLENARRALAARSLANAESTNKGSAWVLITLLLGLAFCAGQFRAWQELRAEGIYLATNPNSSFFYLLTFLHALHVLVGIAVLVYLAGRLLASHTTVRRSLFDNTAVYWHFMDALWLYLLLLCLMKL
ncbi:MAG TPA: cytochrome c oxidase subunit 3 [Candidatus Eremiobacteraceae bacterium]|nr:cytochrome c oxidase subunit 3 [Candidatus Eremiobacteraceae bacterium]